MNRGRQTTATTGESSAGTQGAENRRGSATGSAHDPIQRIPAPCGEVRSVHPCRDHGAPPSPAHCRGEVCQVQSPTSLDQEHSRNHPPRVWAWQQAADPEATPSHPTSTHFLPSLPSVLLPSQPHRHWRTAQLVKLGRGADFSVGPSQTQHLSDTLPPPTGTSVLRLYLALALQSQAQDIPASPNASLSQLPPHGELPRSYDSLRRSWPPSCASGRSFALGLPPVSTRAALPEVAQSLRIRRRWKAECVISSGMEDKR